MGRLGITYDQLARAAEDVLKECGEISQVTMKAVRAKLGDKGSDGTIHKHLTAWKANVPKAPAPSIELPQDLIRSLSSWVSQSATTARADAEDRLMQAEADSVLLAQSGEQLEAERDALLDQSVILTTERDRALATATERAAEIERMAKDVERERGLAGDAQIKAAAARLKLESQTEQIGELKERVAKLNDALDTERQAHGKAETRAAVLQAELEASEKEAVAAVERAKDLQQRLDDAILAASNPQAEHEQRLRERDQEAKAAIAAERNAAQTEREAAQKANMAAQTAAVENADLKARLASAQEKIEGMQAKEK